MPAQKRHKTAYPGVYYILTSRPRKERIYYIQYRKAGRLIEEKAGRQYRDDMTPAAAATLRAKKITGVVPTNAEKRAETEKKSWAIGSLWMEYCRTHAHLRGLSREQRRYKAHLASLDDTPPSAISERLLYGLRDTLLAKLSAKSACNVLDLLGRILSFAREHRLCEVPSVRMPRPRVDNETTEDLTAAQLAKLLGVLNMWPNRQTAGLMLMALYTGMRRGELFSLRWEDVDFERGFIRILHPKGGQSVSIPLNDAAREVLSRHPRLSRYIFPGRGGKKRTECKNGTRAIADAAGLPPAFRPMHGLRHVFASLLASSGKVDIYTLQRLLTHKNPRMTQRYAHLRDDALRRASDELIEQIHKLPR